MIDKLMMLKAQRKRMMRREKRLFCALYLSLFRDVSSVTEEVELDRIKCVVSIRNILMDMFDIDKEIEEIQIQLHAPLLGEVGIRAAKAGRNLRISMASA